MTKTERLKERIELCIVEEINVINIIAQEEPEKYIPRFIKNLTERISEIVSDEVKYGR